MKNIMNSKIVQSELIRLENVKEDIEGRDVEHDISMFRNIVSKVGKLVNNNCNSITIDSDMWHECSISLDKIVEYYGLKYGRVDNKEFTFTIVK